MAAEAEATREARAKVIAAEGEQRASRALKEAAEVIACSPAALQLRYLQTLNSIASERNSTIVFPVPLELFRGYAQPAHSAPPSLPPPSVANVHIDQQTSNALAGQFENLSTTPLPPMAATPMAQLETISNTNSHGNNNNNNNNIINSSSNKLQQQSIVTSSASLLDKVSTNLPTSTGCTHTSGTHPYPAPLPPTLVSRSITSTTSSSIRSMPPEKPSRTSNSNLSDGPVVDWTQFPLHLSRDIHHTITFIWLLDEMLSSSFTSCSLSRSFLTWLYETPLHLSSTHCVGVCNHLYILASAWFFLCRVISSSLMIIIKCH